MNPDTWVDRFRTPSGRKRPSRAEEQLQCQLAAYLHAVLDPPPAGPVWTAVNPLPGMVSPGVGGRRRAMGMRAGWPDLQLLYRKTLVTIEVKADAGRLNDGQAERRAEIVAQGGLWFEARSIDDLAAALDAAGIPRRDRRTGGVA